MNLLASRGVQLHNLTVNFNGAAINIQEAMRASQRSGASLGKFNAHYLDLVPNVIGLNGISKNPVKLLSIPLSLITSFLMLTPWSPHNYP